VDEVSTFADVTRLDGGRAAIVGTYQQVDVRMMPNGDPVYRGHASVVLEDGIEVMLEPMWAPEAIRPQDELASCEGRTVRVIGVIRAKSPKPPQPQATIVGPCVHPVESVQPEA
jgi:hypothetical protein